MHFQIKLGVKTDKSSLEQLQRNEDGPLGQRSTASKPPAALPSSASADFYCNGAVSKPQRRNQRGSQKKRKTNARHWKVSGICFILELRDKDGRPIRVGVNTQFYLYAVCDVTSSLEPILASYDFTRTPDGMGFYRYNERMNAYIEILSYDKIINDAKKRNKILFVKLGI